MSLIFDRLNSRIKQIREEEKYLFPALIMHEEPEPGKTSRFTLNKAAKELLSVSKGNKFAVSFKNDKGELHDPVIVNLTESKIEGVRGVQITSNGVIRSKTMHKDLSTLYSLNTSVENVLALVPNNDTGYVGATIKPVSEIEVPPSAIMQVEQLNH